MIDRYVCKEIAEVWGRRSWLRKAIEIEFAHLGRITGKVAPRMHDLTCNLDEFDRRVREEEAVADHDIAAFVTVLERAMIESGLPDSRLIHYGLTSSDVADTVLSYMFRRSFNLLWVRLSDLGAALKAGFPAEPTPARTHGAVAGPISALTRAERWAEEISWTASRVRGLIFYSKLSGPTGGGVTGPTGEAVQKHANGIESYHRGSTQVIPRQVIAEYMTTLAICVRTVERVAVCLRAAILAGDYSLAAIPGSKGSSSMPHKVNPWKLERISGIARVVSGNAMAALETIPLWLERDMSNSVVERIVPEQSFHLAMLAISSLESVIPRIVVNGASGIIDSNEELCREIRETTASREACHRAVSDRLRS